VNDDCLGVDVVQLKELAWVADLGQRWFEAVIGQRGGYAAADLGGIGADEQG
jgi:hypothetical protein